MRHIKLFENYKSSDEALSTPLYELRIRVTSVEPDENWHNPGYWRMYDNTIVTVLTHKDEKIALEKIASGEYLMDGDIYCDELKLVFSKSNVKLIADGSSTLDEFTENLQYEVYDATLDYYQKNFTVEDDDDDDGEIWGGDGINDDALREITKSGGRDWSFREIGSNEIAEIWDKLTDEETVLFANLAQYHPTLPEEEKKVYRAIELNMKR